MSILRDLRDLTPNQRNAVLASFLGWTLDAFDFFIIVFVLKDIAKEFKVDIPSVTATLFITLAMRPLGAFLFGMAADRFGRRPTLTRLSLLEGFSTREGALNGHRNQKVCTTGRMFYFCSKSFRRELMRGGGWAGSVSLSCSSRIF